MTEQLPTPERLTDDDKIELGIRFAELNHTVIPDSTARRVAMQWHSGQSSALYSLGSCGAINLDRLYPELDECSRDVAADNPDERERNRRHLNALAGYLHSATDRGPIDGWHRLTADDMPPIVHTNTELEPHGAYIGNFSSKMEVAEHLLLATGIYRAITRVVERHGASLAPYVGVNRRGYADDLHNDVMFMPQPDGSIDAYYR